MQKLFLKLTGFAFLLSALFIVGCAEEEEPRIGNAQDPFINVLNATGFVSNGATIIPGQDFQVRVQAQTGDALLNTITIREDGTSLPLSRLKSVEIDGVAQSSANPLALFNDLKNGVTIDFTITAPNSTSLVSYSFTVTDDDGNTDEVTIDLTFAGDPTVSLVDEAGFLSADASLQEAGTFVVKVEATRGGAALQSIGVFEDGVLIDELSRLDFNGFEFDANPFSLAANDKEGFIAEVGVVSHASGIANYAFEILDEDGNKASISINVDIESTAVDGQFTAIMVNNADGPSDSFGGLDLDDTPEAVAFNSADAELRDLGIDTDIAVPENWLQQVEPVNGATLRVPDFTQSENFSFDNANSREAIVAAYDSGIEQTQSEALSVGDLLIVKRNEDYFLLEVTRVEVTTDNNLDFYEFDIKQSFGN